MARTKCRSWGSRLVVLAPVLPAILARLRNPFDLDARPDLIVGQLALDPLLAPVVARQCGLRVPGAFDAFELGMRAILGQQVSVRAASTLAGRLVQQLGEPIETPFACLNRIAPAAETLARARRNGCRGVRVDRAGSRTARLGRAVDLVPACSPGRRRRWHLRRCDA